MATRKNVPGSTNRSSGSSSGASNRKPKNATTLGKAARLSRAQGGGGPDSATAQRLFKRMTGQQGGRPRNR